MPPYPFFRPALREFKANPEAFVRDNLGVTLSNADNIDEVIERVANALETQMKKNATAEGPGRSPGVNPEHPQVQSGNLRRSIKARRID